MRWTARQRAMLSEMGVQLWGRAGETTADAPLPFLGTTENAMPSSVQETRPRMLAQAKVNHWVAVEGSWIL